MNIKSALIYAATKLKAIGIREANLEARILLIHAINKPFEYILSNPNEILTEDHTQQYDNYINRRLQSEPISYITGVKEFYGREFFVSNKVLIPRGDTEILVDAMLEKIQLTPYLRRKSEYQITILELGVGSGCISISLLLENPSCKIIATDISAEAIIVAKRNATKYNVNDRIKFIKSDWFDQLNEENKFDFIISNPPYISENEISYMAEETISYEPNLALFADNDGLNAYEKIAISAKKFLKPQGKLLIEIGFQQEKRVGGIFTQNGYKIERALQDLSGYTRVLILS